MAVNSLNNIQNTGNNKLRAQSGFSLIEVMIAALVISIGMLGIAGLQLVSMKGSHQSYMRHQAMFVVQDLVERMRANPNAVRVASPVYLFDTTDSTAPNCAAPPPNCGTSTSNCTVTDIANYDKYSVACKMKNTLSDGRIQVRCQPVDPIDGSGGCVEGLIGVQVSWSERQMGKESLKTINATADSLFPADTNRTDNITIYSRIN